MRRELPSGTVTFLFTDIEGSTELLHQLGTAEYGAALAEHRRVLRKAFVRHRGVEVDTQGDSLFVVFADPAAAVSAAGEAQQSLKSGPIAVRMGMHTGAAHLTDEGYVGPDVHLGARIAAAGYGGQVLLSQQTRDALIGARPKVVVEANLVELGEHRVKGFAEPIAIFQLGIVPFPPLRTISNTNLPSPASTFVGRERETGDVCALLRDSARLVTLTGPGGTGKTRLAIEAASQIVPEFKAGVFWVSLAALRDPALVVQSIGNVIGAKGPLAEHVGEREMLLVLDNLEQVIDAAPELSPVLSACPRLRLLVTSRELLRISGEHEYAVPPLNDGEAVELFLERAAVPTSAAVGELCHRLDNLPLAIELAAARARVLTPDQILQRLGQRLDLLKGGRDAEARQQTLRATIAWSYDLLAEQEQQLLARLSVFRGGWTLETAEVVSAADLDTLGSLVDKSLLRRSGQHFTMLETIREFAAERLEESGEADEMRGRHADWFLALAEEAFPHLKGDPKASLDRVEGDHDNLRAALDFLTGSGQTQAALELGGALYRFWYMRGHLTEGRRRIDELLRADDRPTAARARALNGAAVMALDTGAPAAAKQRAEEALVLHRALGDPWGVTYSNYLIGMAATEVSDWQTALPYFEESSEAFRELGDDHYTLLATEALGWVYGELGDRERARTLQEQTLVLARAQGDLGVVALELWQLAWFALADGQVQHALAMVAESLRIDRDLGNRGAIVDELCTFARALAADRRPEQAAELLGAAESLRQEIGGGPAWVVDSIAETRQQLDDQLDYSTLTAAWERGQKLSADEAVEIALALETIE